MTTDRDLIDGGRSSSLGGELALGWIRRCSAGKKYMLGGAEARASLVRDGAASASRSPPGALRRVLCGPIASTGRDHRRDALRHAQASAAARERDVRPRG